MSWFSVVPTVVAGVALLFLPGVLPILALGLRNPAYLAVVPLLSVTIVSVAAIIAPYLGVDWSVQPVAVVSLSLGAVFFGVRKLLKQPAQSWRSVLGIAKRMPIITGAGFLIGAASIALQLRSAFGRPENISQTFDNVFHLNAVRYVLETGNASSLTITGMTNGDNPPYFYPAAWHGLASLLIQITGASLPVAVNVLNLCIATTVWTLGCMFLVRTVMGSNPYAIGAAGVLAAGFGSFPILLLDFGVLYPNFLSVSMLPAALACVSIFFGISSFAAVSQLARYSLAPLVALGVAVAHPNGVMSLAAMSIPVFIISFAAVAIARRKTGKTAAVTLLLGAGVFTILAVIAVLWKYVRPPAAAATWLPVQTPGQAVGEVLTSSAMQRPPAWTVSILVILGLIYLLKRPFSMWLSASYVITAALFVIVSAGPPGRIRDLLTGVWYNDSYRLAALLPVTAVALGAIGAAWMIESLQARIKSRVHLPPIADKLRQPAAFYTAGPLALLGVLALLQAPPMTVPVRSAQANYSTTPDSPLVSSDELALIDELDRYVPRDATVAVNPWTGGAMAFALADRNTTSKHTLTTYTKATELLNDKFREAATDPAICPAARSNDVRYVLDFGAREVHGGNHGFQGLQIPDSTPGFELLARHGDAKLFEVTACM